MTIDPKERALLAAHHERVRTISTERQRILQQQAEVLRSHVRAGVQLPTATTGAVGPANRGHLIEQLTQEEAASRAALEALKQVTHCMQQSMRACALLYSGRLRARACTNTCSACVLVNPLMCSSCTVVM